MTRKEWQQFSDQNVSIEMGERLTKYFFNLEKKITSKKL